RRALGDEELPAARQPSADAGAMARRRLNEASALALVLVLDGSCCRCFGVCGSIEHVVCRGFDRPFASPQPLPIAGKTSAKPGAITTQGRPPGEEPFLPSRFGRSQADKTPVIRVRRPKYLWGVPRLERQPVFPNHARRYSLKRYPTPYSVSIMSNSPSLAL